MPEPSVIPNRVLAQVGRAESSRVGYAVAAIST
jgi:hypothetical protein